MDGTRRRTGTGLPKGWSRPLLVLLITGILLTLHRGFVVAQEADEAPLTGDATAAIETSPQATPVSVEAPPGATPISAVTPIRFIPPLSLAECQALMKRAESLIPTDPAADPDPAWTASLLSMVDVASNYLNFRSDLHTSLSHFRWIELGGGRVDATPDGIDRDEKIFRVPVSGISALSFEARHGDVYLHRLVVFDEHNLKRQEFDFTREPRLLRHGIPRRDVYHLWRRTSISRLEMEYSAAREGPPGSARPRVAIFGGQTNRSRPEHVKTAMWHLQESKKAISTRDWSLARQELGLANARLSDYLRRNNPR